jgi:hypothetical protein
LGEALPGRRVSQILDSGSVWTAQIPGGASFLKAQGFGVVQSLQRCDRSTALNLRFSA